MSPFPKHAILPCEIKSREFDSKLLLACFLAERGWTSIVGSRNDIHMKLHRFPRSVYLGKDVRFSSATIVRILRLLGHRFVAMDEEAQFFLSREKYRKARVNDYVLSQAERLFAWGPENALAWQEAATYSGQRIHETGNGRIDLLRPEMRSLYSDRTSQLRALYGDFILVNTNFGAINHFFGNLSVNVSESDKEPAKRAHSNGYLLHRQKLFQSFVQLMPAMAKAFPKTKIVLRPHPGENQDFWRSIVQHNPNVEINGEGSVVPWILASKALVHNGCTTGLEAYMLGVPAIAYQPHECDEFELRLPNALSIKATTEEELFVELENTLEGRMAGIDLHTKERNDVLAQFVATEAGEFATQEIAAGLEDFATSSGSVNSNIITWPIGAIATLGRSLLKRYHRNRLGHKSNVAYTLHRFPHTPINDVQLRISEFAACLARFSSVKVRQLDENIFAVQKRGV